MGKTHHRADLVTCDGAAGRVQSPTWVKDQNHMWYLFHLSTPLPATATGKGLLLRTDLSLIVRVRVPLMMENVLGTFLAATNM